MRAGRLVIGALILILVGNARPAAQDASRIIGVYRLIEDKPSGFRPSEGSEITLSVEGDGKMNITALRPGNALTAQGTYAIRGNLISLDFPEFGKSVRLQPWSLNRDELRLPMQFIGNKDKAFARSVFNEARYVFALMAKPTFCVRETAGLMRHIVKYRESIFYPEDGWLAEVEEYDNTLLALFGEDGRECELPDFDVLYLCWMARWNSNDPESGCRALQNAYNDFWSKGRFSRLKSPFANAGVRGTHVPTEEEVRFARHLVCGDVCMPGGRFTLNDAEPVRQKTGK